MFKILQYLTIVSFIRISYGNPFNIQNDLEYVFHLTYFAGSNASGDLSKNLVFETDLQVQKQGENEFHCKFSNILVPESGNEEILKPFVIVMNETRIGSLVYPSTWGSDEILHVHGMVKGVLADRSDLTKFFDDENYSTKQSVMMPLGECDADISTFVATKENEKIFTIQAVSTKDNCNFTDEEQRILRHYVDMVDGSSNAEVKIFYNLDNPVQIYIKLVLRLPEGEDGEMIDNLAELTIKLEDTKEIETRIEGRKTLTITKDEILDLHKNIE